MGPIERQQIDDARQRKARLGIGQFQRITPEYKEVLDERAILTEQFLPNWMVTPCGPSRPSNWIEAEPVDFCPEGAPVGVSEVVRAVASEFGITLAQIKGKSRSFKFTRPRQIAMYLARRVTLKSMPTIAFHLGGRDHTTVLHGDRKIQRLIEVDDDLAALVSKLEARITQ